MLYLKSLTLILSPLKFLIKTESSHLPPHSPLPCTANFPYLVSPAFHHSQLPISWQHLVTWPISDNVSNRISELRLAQRSTFRGSWLLNVIFIRLQRWPKCQHPLCSDLCLKAYVLLKMTTKVTREVYFVTAPSLSPLEPQMSSRRVDSG